MVDAELMAKLYNDQDYEYHRRVNSFVHKTAIIGRNVSIGEDCYIGPYCTIQSNVIIGNGNIFEAHVSIGSPAEHKDDKFNRLKFEQDGLIRIGDNNQFKEFITINRPTKTLTRVGSRCFIMRGCHISHDSLVDDDVIMSCNVVLGGHSWVMDGAYLAIGSITHPFTVIGPYAMLGMGTIATKKTQIKPWRIYTGSPARFLKMNRVGVHRSNLTLRHYFQHNRTYNIALGAR